MVTDAPGDTRRVLRRIAAGDLGRLPGLEAVGRRPGRNLERLTSAIAFAALVIGGWHDIFGELMIVSGFVGIIIINIRALRRDPDQR